MIKNAFYFILKSLFVHNIQIFFLTFWSCSKNSFIKKISLFSKFMTSQPGNQTISILILPNISRSKSNHTIKIGQVIEHNDRKIFLQKSFRKWGKETSSRLLFVFQKNVIWVKATVLKFSFNILQYYLAYNKNKLHKTLGYWSKIYSTLSF